MAVETAAEAVTLPLPLWGAVGGSLAEVLRWYRVRDSLHEGVPDWASDWKYWVPTLLMIGVGSLLVLMHLTGNDPEPRSPQRGRQPGGRPSPAEPDGTFLVPFYRDLRGTSLKGRIDGTSSARQVDASGQTPTSP